MSLYNHGLSKPIGSSEKVLYMERADASFTYAGATGHYMTPLLGGMRYAHPDELVMLCMYEGKYRYHLRTLLQSMTLEGGVLSHQSLEGMTEYYALYYNAFTSVQELNHERHKKGVSHFPILDSIECRYMNHEATASKAVKELSEQISQLLKSVSESSNTASSEYAEGVNYSYTSTLNTYARILEEKTLERESLTVDWDTLKRKIELVEAMSALCASQRDSADDVSNLKLIQSIVIKLVDLADRKICIESLLNH